MEIKSFKDIRKEFPDDYLVLVDYESRELPSGELEVTGAKNVHAFKSGREMYNAYRDLSKKGMKAVFVTPFYQDSFVMEQRFSMRVGSVAWSFEYRGGLLYVPLVIHYDTEVSLTGIIDTGSAGTVVDVDCFDIDLLSRNAKAVCVYGVGGSQEAFVQTVNYVKLGEYRISNFEIEFCDLKDDFGFEAIIGSNLLDNLGAVIDYRTKEIHLR